MRAAGDSPGPVEEGGKVAFWGTGEGFGVTVVPHAGLGSAALLPWPRATVDGNSILRERE